MLISASWRQILRGKHFYYPNITPKETEGQRNEVSCLRSHSLEATEPKFKFWCSHAHTILPFLKLVVFMRGREGAGEGRFAKWGIVGED